MNRILLTNVNGSNESVLVFTTLTAEVLRASFEKHPDRKLIFDDCVSIREDEVQFYLFEPCWFTDEQDRRAATIAAA